MVEGRGQNEQQVNSSKCFPRDGNQDNGIFHVSEINTLTNHFASKLLEITDQQMRN
jgi:hypothetical protein